MSMGNVVSHACAGKTFSERNPRRWGEIVNEIVCNVDIVAGGSSQFFGEMHTRKLGPLELLTINCERESARRDRRHIASDPDELALLMFVESGELRISQLGRELVVGPGSAVFYDLTLPYTYYHSDRTKLLAVKVPISVLKARLGRHSQYLGRNYCGIAGPVGITARYLGSLMDGIAGVPQSLAPEYASKSFDLIALMLESGGGSMAVPRSEALSALFRRAVAVIGANLSNPDLDPAAIARLVGISERYLHKVFQEAGTSVNECLRERRLQQAYRDLRSPARRSLSVGEIGTRAGFSSASHFSRTFRKRFGIPANAVRRGEHDAVDDHTAPAV